MPDAGVGIKLDSTGAFRACLELFRAPNLFTAASDVLAGYAVAGVNGNPAWLMLASMGIYAGGVAFNDIFDRKLDAIERPERPLPSGRLTTSAASIAASAALICGVCLAITCSLWSGLFAATIGLLAFIYDFAGKRTPLGPLNMGLCRAFNFLLGVSAKPSALVTNWHLGLLALVYITGLTFLSRSEVSGASRTAVRIAATTTMLVASGLMATAIIRRSIPGEILAAWFVAGTFPPFWRCWRNSEATNVRRVIKAGILSLVLLDASLAASYKNPGYGAAILLLGAISLLLARVFATT
ncbi:MAG TPA: UbiA-like protein EboC [Candidatus Angelobacter sp.]|nr:UbiA-like protein EboC [Candidatus Angelobacter sp.]